MLKRLLAISMLLLPQAASAISGGDALGFSPFWEWKTIETEHFRISFPTEVTAIASKAAGYFEEANAAMSPIFRWQPHYKAQIVIVDNSDAANGLTSPIARLGIVLFVTPPANWFSTANYDDWLRLVVFHEYTHFLNIDTTTGVYEILRYIFGDVLLPNGLWPSWMLEGLAVHMETHFTKAGRGRSTLYTGILRSAVEEGVLNTPEFVTLGRINGPRPDFPGGETAYLFGQQLMTEVSREPVAGSLITEGSLQSGEDVLGLMSHRSGGRVPYFTNGNLENLTGKDWYEFWDHWVARMHQMMTEDLVVIRSRPLTKIDRLTNAETVSGSAVSPDGNWIAYINDSEHYPEALYIRNLKTGETKRVVDTELGSTVCFSTDGKLIFFSSIRRHAEYNLWSDLGVYDIARDKVIWLTDGLRAQDPSISKDGSWIAFTYTENNSVGVAVAPISRDPTTVTLGPITKLVPAANLDRASTPKFSPDGETLFYSVHVNGEVGEDLMAVDRASGKVSTLVKDGSYNRHPQISPSGDLYFVTDATGVSNVFRYRGKDKPQMMTNVTGGVIFPSFGPAPGPDAPGAQPPLYVTSLSYRGWDLAHASYDPATETDPDAVNVSRDDFFPEPKVPYHADNKPPHIEIQDYSVFPSIWPRAWAPVFFAGAGETYFGAEAFGFDATYRHEYSLFGGYDTLVHKADWNASYSNRSFGPTLTLQTSGFSNSISTSGTGVLEAFSRQYQFSAQISYPILWTFSSLTPAIGVKAQRTVDDFPNLIGGTDSLFNERYVPDADASVYYTNARGSSLGISPESGRALFAGARAYWDETTPLWKGLVTEQEFIQLWPHTVLVPTVAGSVISRNSSFSSANVVVEGRQTPQVFNTEPYTDFDQLGLRGYPLQTYYAKAAAVGSLEFRFPLLRIFNGPGTYPLNFQNIYGFGFGEAAFFPLGEPGAYTLPAAGGGIRMSTHLLVTVPVTFSVEYHKGFRDDIGGKGELFVQLLFAPVQI